MDFDNVRVVANSFKSDGNVHLDQFNLTKATMQLTIKSDEQCENRIRHVNFDPYLNLCTFDDTLDLAKDTNGVRYKKYYNIDKFKLDRIMCLKRECLSKTRFILI